MCHGTYYDPWRVPCQIVALIELPRSCNASVRHVTLADRIRTARKAAGYTSQLKLANAVGVSERTVKRWEAGTHVPEEDNRRDLARVLGGSADEWLGVRQPATPRLTLSAIQAELAAVDETLRELTASVNELLPLVRQALGLPDVAPEQLPAKRKAAA